MSDIIRIIRVLEYTGPRDHLEKVLAQNAVKGTQVFGDITIREASLGSYPEVVGKVKPKIIIGLEARDWDDFICNKCKSFPTFFQAANPIAAETVQSDMTKLGYEVQRQGSQLTIIRHKSLDG